MRRWVLRVLGAAGMLAFFSAPLFALNSEMNRATLEGLKGVRVLIEDLDPEIERGGLGKDSLQKEVEKRLEVSGIKVLGQEEAAKEPGEPYLYLNLNISCLKNVEENCSYSIDMALIQNVTLIRNPRQTTYAVTWSTGGVGLLTKKSLGQLKGSVGEVVDIFIRAFFSVNPKK